MQFEGALKNYTVFAYLILLLFETKRLLTLKALVSRNCSMLHYDQHRQYQYHPDQIRLDPEYHSTRIR
jgi:hypothetical protein